MVYILTCRLDLFHSHGALRVTLVDGVQGRGKHHDEQRGRTTGGGQPGLVAVEFVFERVDLGDVRV